MGGEDVMVPTRRLLGCAFVALWTNNTSWQKQASKNMNSNIW